MSFSPRGSVQEGLCLLAKRLDPIITERLSDVLGECTWTTILRELDQAKGYIGREYSTADLQAQLRMLTERLGKLGYPFDDSGTRIVSTLGGELRIVRNRWAHNTELTAMDAWRTHDFVARLLEYFGDHDGFVVAQELGNEALRIVAIESGVVVDSLMADSMRSTSRIPGIGESDTSDSPSPYIADEEELVTPDPSVFVRGNAELTPCIGGERTEFEPWVPVAVGDLAILDELPKKHAKEQLRAVAIEITEFEGPIHIERLAELTAAAFGLNRLHPRRRRQIERQIKATHLAVDTGRFVWPSSIDREKWEEFRPNSSSVDRPFLHISPVEIANAARFICENEEGINRVKLETQILQTFGRRRRTPQFKKHLSKALDSQTT